MIYSKEQNREDKNKSEIYKSKEEYFAVLKNRSRLPEGFLCSTVPLAFYPMEKKAPNPLKMNLSLISLENPTPLFGAVFTKNSFPGMPIIIGRERLTGSHIRGILINNKIANVSIENGRQDTEQLLKKLGELQGGRPVSEYFPCSTGIIGWRLPVEEMLDVLDPLVSGLDSNNLILPVAQAIMTTDSFPKIRDIGIGSGRILGIAKGAGMIEPNLATMLVFIITDIAISRDSLRKALSWCAERTFNHISIDSDQSTSDTAILLSSGRKPGVKEVDFRDALYKVCRQLAEDVVRNGEGTGHVIRIRLKGAQNNKIALGAAKAIANSLLVKTAVFGDDPNIGRLLVALGDFFGTLGAFDTFDTFNTLGTQGTQGTQGIQGAQGIQGTQGIQGAQSAQGIAMDVKSISIKIGGVTAYEKGCFKLDKDKEKRLSDYLKDCKLDASHKGYPEHNKKVDIDIVVGKGKGEAEVLGSDLSHDYIKINAEYRT